MKSNNYSLVLYVALLFFGLNISHCNKPFTPPEIVGVWRLGALIQGQTVKAFADFNNDTYAFLLAKDLIDQNGNLHLPEGYEGLKDKISDAFTDVLLFLEDINSITLKEDGTFQFSSLSQTQNAAGTYKQENQFIFFYCTTPHFEEVDGSLLAATDGNVLELYPSTLILTSFFSTFFSEEELELLFGSIKPPTGVEGIIFFTHTN